MTADFAVVRQQTQAKQKTSPSSRTCRVGALSDDDDVRNHRAQSCASKQRHLGAINHSKKPEKASEEKNGQKVTKPCVVDVRLCCTRRTVVVTHSGSCVSGFDEVK